MNSGMTIIPGLILEERKFPVFNALWGNYGSGYESVHYFKIQGGLVALGGAAKMNGSVDRVVFTLPVGYRPRAELWFYGYDSNTVAVSIHPDGRVQVRGGATTAADFYPMDGIFFRL